MAIVPAAAGEAQPPVDLGDLQLFVVLAEELHFGRAAVRLHLSQPGLSYRVKRMEDALGYALLSRSRRSVELTAAGTSLLEGARRLLGEARRVADDGGRVARGELATLQVGFVGTALYSLLPDVLREARRRHPQLRVVPQEQKTAAQVRALQLGQLDLGVVHLPLPEGTGLESTPLLTDPVGVAVPAEGRLARTPGALRLADLADEPFVLFPRELEPQTYDRYVDACIAAGFAPRIAAQATGLQTILALIAAGVGVGFVAASVAQHLQRSGVAFRPLPEGPAPVLTTGAAWRPEGSHPGVALLRDVLQTLPRPDQPYLSPAGLFLLD